MINIRKISNGFVLIFAVAYAIKFFLLSQGDVLNNYPIISPDGFDWYTEGYYLANSAKLGAFDSLPILRPPFFVLVTAVDSLIGNGFFLSLLYGFCILINYFSIMWLLENELSCNEEKYIRYASFPVALCTTIYPINFIKGFLLSDALAVGLTLLAVTLLIRYKNSKKLSFLGASILMAIAASMTQTYSLIPYFIISMCIIVDSYAQKKLIDLKVLLGLISLTLIFLTLTFLWRDNINHNDTPSNFNLFKLSGEMINFYVNTWIYYFWIFILFALRNLSIADFYKKRECFYFGCLLTVCVMGCLCIFYQWPESRFTYYFWPWFLLAFFIIISKVNSFSMIMLLTVGIIFNSCISVPNPWGPKLNEVTFNFKKNWAYEFFSAKSVDRHLYDCVNAECPSNTFLQSSDGYVKSVVGFNLKIRKTLNERGQSVK